MLTSMHFLKAILRLVSLMLLGISCLLLIYYFAFKKNTLAKYDRVAMTLNSNLSMPGKYIGTLEVNVSEGSENELFLYVLPARSGNISLDALDNFVGCIQVIDSHGNNVYNHVYDHNANPLDFAVMPYKGKNVPCLRVKSLDVHQGTYTFLLDVRQNASGLVATPHLLVAIYSPGLLVFANNIVCWVAIFSFLLSLGLFGLSMVKTGASTSAQRGPNGKKDEEEKAKV